MVLHPCPRRVVLYVVGLVTVAALTLSSPVGAITYGSVDTTHAGVGAILQILPGGGWWEWCSGTLVSPRVFFTARRCTALFAD